jgi:hypothetical protein
MVRYFDVLSKKGPKFRQTVPEKPPNPTPGVKAGKMGRPGGGINDPNHSHQYTGRAGLTFSGFSVCFIGEVGAGYVCPEGPGA